MGVCSSKLDTFSTSDDVDLSDVVRRRSSGSPSHCGGSIGTGGCTDPSYCSFSNSSSIGKYKFGVLRRRATPCGCTDEDEKLFRPIRPTNDKTFWEVYELEEGSGVSLTFVCFVRVVWMGQFATCKVFHDYQFLEERISVWNM
jgi:hypothetical protein